VPKIEREPDRGHPAPAQLALDRMASGRRRPLLRQPEPPPLHRRGDRRGPIVHAELGEGLVPLALHGGPLWEPLCYAQIGGLAIATVITLLLVPVFYSISVLDLKIVKWEPGKH
jgi:hypothetical protein